MNSKSLISTFVAEWDEGWKISLRFSERFVDMNSMSSFISKLVTSPCSLEFIAY
ncbi:hypothetical protein STEG23_024567, partial [Scotinomys teguina]